MNLNRTNQTDDTELVESTEAEGETQIPLGIGGADVGLDPFASSSASRRIKSGSMVVVFVVALAAVGLFAMRWMTKVTVASGREDEAERKVGDYLDGLKKDTAKRDLDSADVVHVLNDDFTDRQIPLSDVQKDPFVLYDVVIREVDPKQEDASEDQSQRVRDSARQKRMNEIQSALSNLRVKSILLGSNPLANLDGQIVRVGELIKTPDDAVKLRVLSIDQDSLVVFAEDPVLDIKIEHTLFVRPNSK